MSAYSSQQSDPWFRLGRIGVTTTVGVVLLGAASIIAWIIAPFLMGILSLRPEQVLGGEVWRLFSWPLIDGISLWTLLNLALIWLFGRDIEAQIGRSRMLALFGGIWLALTLTTTLTGLVVPGTELYGLSMVEFCLLLLWIAEWPTRRFFFNIPAWVFGLVILALQILPAIAMRSWGSLIGLLLSLALVALAARRVGLLAQYRWLPGTPSTRQQRPPKRRPTAEQRQARQRLTDDQRIDELLDKINASGIHSLTRAERSELEKLRQRRR